MNTAVFPLESNLLPGRKKQKFEIPRRISVPSRDGVPLKPIEGCPTGSKSQNLVSYLDLEKLCLGSLSSKENIVRKCSIPDIFKDLMEYEDKWRNAVSEELSISLRILAKSLSVCLEDHNRIQKGRAAGSDSSQAMLENSLKKRNILLHHNCTFRIAKSKKTAANVWNGTVMQRNDNGGKEKKKRYFLSINLVGKAKAYRYAIVVSSPLLFPVIGC